MIVVTVFLSIMNQILFFLVQNRKENCHHDHIPFTVKGNIVFSVYETGMSGVEIGDEKKNRLEINAKLQESFNSLTTKAK